MFMCTCTCTYLSMDKYTKFWQRPIRHQLCFHNRQCADDICGNVYTSIILFVCTCPYAYLQQYRLTRVNASYIFAQRMFV